MQHFPRWANRPSRSHPVPREGVEPLQPPRRETWLGWAALSGLMMLGLLSHLLISWLLSFPYAYFERGICEVDCISTITGWQAGGSILMVPVFPYLLCLLPILWRWKWKWLETCLKLNVLVNLVCFLLFNGGLLYSQVADLYNTSKRDAAYGIHLTLILLAVVSSSGSSLVLGFLLRQRRKFG